MSDPPSHFLCPISLGTMSHPMLVEHNGHPFYFDRDSLEEHLKTEGGHRNPISREEGFDKALMVLDKELQSQIMASEWAPENVDSRPFERPSTPTRFNRPIQSVSIVDDFDVIVINERLPFPIAQQLLSAFLQGGFRIYEL